MLVHLCCLCVHFSSYTSWTPYGLRRQFCQLWILYMMDLASCWLLGTLSGFPLRTAYRLATWWITHRCVCFAFTCAHYVKKCHSVSKRTTRASLKSCWWFTRDVVCSTSYGAFMASVPFLCSLCVLEVLLRLWIHAMTVAASCVQATSCSSEVYFVDTLLSDCFSGAFRVSFDWHLVCESIGLLCFQRRKLPERYLQTRSWTSISETLANTENCSWHSAAHIRLVGCGKAYQLHRRLAHGVSLHNAAISWISSVHYVTMFIQLSSVSECLYACSISKCLGKFDHAAWCTRTCCLFSFEPPSVWIWHKQWRLWL